MSYQDFARTAAGVLAGALLAGARSPRRKNRSRHHGGHGAAAGP